MAKDEYHRADAKALLDDRGYSGALIRGQNPALLFEKGVRDRITESYFWKEQCFGLNAATLCDRAAELKFIGGTAGIMGKPTPFLCLAFKLLQLVPEKEIILEYLNFADEDGEEGDEEVVVKDDDGHNNGTADLNGIQDPNALGKLGEFKYLRCLAAFYIRLAWSPVDIYTTLEPLLSDFRKIKRRTKDGFALTYMDQFVDDLLTKDRICATSLWKLPSRANLEDLEMLDPRESPLGDEVDMLDAEEDEGSEGDVQIADSDRGRRRFDSEDRSDRSRRSYYSEDGRSDWGSRRYDSDDDRSDMGSRRRSHSRDDRRDSRSRRRSHSRDDRSRSRSRKRSNSADDRSEGEVRPTSKDDH
ncbi:PRP38-domain-containing protein [Melanomma pulvis-pyrius CBS 109.77]|uniref:Pre-mRNA-splicing factor 38 n=1 Tax=Melanomma pulvis-pyrius CBS 109.77 TaxID=1314802 RepID=A0A6A6WY97_9PLEO|nr:PRP38-domain-containing protein [Melanomma pulvis-pyrius CBS 109.77]